MSWRDRFQARSGPAAPAGPKGWHSRGYLPHLDDPAQTQSLNFRLADSMPEHVIESWRADVEALPPELRDRERTRRVESFLDTGHGSCILRDHGQIVEDSLLYFDRQRYDLHAWCVMPNHVHVLITAHDGVSVGKLVSSWKRFTANQINRATDDKGQLWFEDYFDRFIRNEEHYWNEVAYIENNPVAAGLAATTGEWPYSSARRRHL